MNLILLLSLCLLFYRETYAITGPLSPYGFGNNTATTYDDEDRLTGWTRDDNNKTQTWNLSKVGDWDTFAQAGSNPFTETRTHGDTHELTIIAGGNNPGPLVHDAKGNITGNSNTQGYDWDFDNRMKSATVGADIHQYSYDALGRRVSKAVMTGGGTGADGLTRGHNRQNSLSIDKDFFQNADTQLASLVRLSLYQRMKICGREWGGPFLGIAMDVGQQGHDGGRV